MWTKERAFKYLLNWLKQSGYKNITVKSIDMFGHAMIKTDRQNFYFLYKKDHLKSFNNLFPRYQTVEGALSGYGESINREYMKYAKELDAELVYTYRNIENALYTPSRKKLYALVGMCYPETDLSIVSTLGILSMYCAYYELIRQQDKENTYKTNDYSANTITMQETTFCFPFALMERLK
jgi:hypothetical protein